LQGGPVLTTLSVPGHELFDGIMRTTDSSEVLVDHTDQGGHVGALTIWNAGFSNAANVTAELRDAFGRLATLPTVTIAPQKGLTLSLLDVLGPEVAPPYIRVKISIVSTVTGLSTTVVYQATW
jgi:hypothetical protein